MTLVVYFKVVLTCFFMTFACFVFLQTIFDNETLRTVISINHRAANRLRNDKTHRKKTEIPKFIQRSSDETRFNISICVSSPLLLVMVTSAPEHVLQRKRIRETWGKIFSSDDGEMLWSVTQFAVGLSTNLKRNFLIESEFKQYRDIIIGQYIDSYRNLTLKVLNGLSYAERHCLPKFLLKTDDDCFVNVPLVIRFLKNYNKQETNLYVGRVTYDSAVVRNRKSPYHVAYDHYHDNIYPPYPSGLGYLISDDVLRRILVKSRTVPAFPNEDAYIGVLAALIGLQPINSARFQLNTGWRMCNFIYLMVVHEVRPRDQKSMMTLATRALQVCEWEDSLRKWR